MNKEQADAIAKKCVANIIGAGSDVGLDIAYIHNRISETLQTEIILEDNPTEKIKPVFEKFKETFDKNE